MSFNIKNEETCHLATELARLTSETKTKAIAIALCERLIRIQHARCAQGRLKEMRAVAKRSARFVGP